MIGCFIYPVINFIVIIALDLSSKKAIGRPPGSSACLAILGEPCRRRASASMITHYREVYGLDTAWKIVLYTILACTFMAMALLMFTWKMKPRA